MRSVYRPRFGKYLTIAMGTLCAGALVIILIGDGTNVALRSAPWLALLAGAVWASYWRPMVAIDDAGVHVVNVLRTIDLPWPAIQRIDTKWALTLYSPYGKVTAWAAPAPSGFAVRNLTRADLRGLPESTYLAGSVRPGDSPGSPSGAAALLVRRRWEQLRDAGFLDDPKLEKEQVPVRWHWNILGGAALLAGLGVIGALTG